MIIGIICLIMLIAGIALMIYGLYNDNLLLTPLIGGIMAFIGFIGLIYFISVNVDIISSWFKI